MDYATMFKNMVLMHPAEPWEALREIEKGGSYEPYLFAEFGQRSENASAAVLIFIDQSTALFTMRYVDNPDDGPDGYDAQLNWDILSWTPDQQAGALDSYLLFVDEYKLPIGPNEQKARKAIKGIKFHHKKRDIVAEHMESLSGRLQ